MARGATPKASAKSGAGSKAVATKEAEQQALAVYDYGEDAGGGFDNLERGDYAIPFLYLLQSNSPKVEKGEASAGQIMNTVSEELFPAIKAKGEQGVLFVPVYSDHVCVEWRPQDAGGGLVGQHSMDSSIVIDAKQNHKFGQWKSPDGNDLVDTYYNYGMLVRDLGDLTSFEQAVMAYNSTKIKPYRQWLTRMKTMKVETPSGARITPPMWAHLWRITSVMQTKHGKNFYNLEINFAGDNAAGSRIAPSEPIYQMCKDFNALCKEGNVKVATESLQREPGDSEAGDVDPDGPVPF